MRAILFDDYGGPDVLYSSDVPAPALEPGSVRVRVLSAAVNPADTKWRQGMFRSFAPLTFPHVPGYDIAGFVDAVGPNVANVRVGDRVMAMLSKGAYAEYAAVPAHAATPVPDGLDLGIAAALPTAGLTGVQMIEDHVRPSAGQTVLVTGAVGAVGRFATFAAHRFGARVVAAVRARQASAAWALGAAEVIALGEEDWTGAPFDHVVDTVGGPAVAALCRHVRPGGLVRTAATTPIDPDGLASQPVFVVVRNDPRKLAALAGVVAAGDVQVPIALRRPLEEAAQFHRLMEAGAIAGKLILEP